MIAVVGCGNTNRSDDGAGPGVIRALQGLPDLACDKQVHLLDAGTDGIAVLLAAHGCDQLILIDACQPFETPGAIHEVAGRDLEPGQERPFNLHDFRWDHALHAGRRIYGERFAGDVSVYLIEAQTLHLGLNLSPPVGAAVARLAASIADRLRAHRRRAVIRAPETVL